MVPDNNLLLMPSFGLWGHYMHRCTYIQMKQSHIKKVNKPGVVLLTLNPSTQKVEAGGSLLVQGQPSLLSELQDSWDYRETLS